MLYLPLYKVIDTIIWYPREAVGLQVDDEFFMLCKPR